MSPHFADVQANINTIVDAIYAQSTDLLIFPELSTCGYFYTDRKQLYENALTKDSHDFLPIQDAARKNQSNVVFGFAECDGEKIYNSSLLINSNGLIQGIYRKVHLFYFENLLFTPGDVGFPTFDIQTQQNEQVKVGMQICYDWRFPEATRSLALGGAHIIAIPACIVTTTGMLHDTLRVRAFENKVIVAFSDRVGSETNSIDNTEETLRYRGESCIINFNGEILASLDDSTNDAITCEVDPMRASNKDINAYNNILTDRKPERYNA